MDLPNKLRAYLIWLINYIDDRVFNEDPTSRSLYSLTQRAIEWTSRHIDKIGYILLPILGLSLRLYNYAIIPSPIATTDEYAFAWCGWSLLHGQKPTSWSLLPSYDNWQLVIWRGISFRIVSPWFDHPPLFCLVVGVAAIIGGAPTMFDCALEFMRIPSIVFGTLSTVLVYSLGSRLYNKGIGMVSAVLYATVPVIVITNRLAVVDNMLTFLLLLAIYSTLQYFENNAPKYLGIILVCVSSAILTKLPGVSVTIIVAIILFAYNYRKEGLYVILSGFLAILSYLLYGLLLDWHLFVAVNAAQGERFTLHYKLFFDILTLGSSVTYTWIDGWVIWSWFALLYAGIKDKEQILSISAGMYMITIILSAGFFAYYWYIFPLFPFFCLACGKYLNDLIKQPNIIFFLLFFVTAWLFIFLGIYSEIYHFVRIRIIYVSIARLILSGLFGGYVLHFIFHGRRTKAVCSTVTVFLFSVFILVNIFVVIYAHEILPLLDELSRKIFTYYELP
ncbi:MAG: ArnT family glycosyltransferase [Promethearchaeota archaeon]